MDRLRKIDIPAARAEIVKSIAEYRRLAILTTMVEIFLREVDGRKIDARVASKFQLRLQNDAPVLKVYRVSYAKDGQTMSGRPVYKFCVFMYDMTNEKHTFSVNEKEDGRLDIDGALIADRKWREHADFLEERLNKFAYHASKFNDMLQALHNAAEFAMMPGDHFPVYPLGSHFQWYALTDIKPG